MGVTNPKIFVDHENHNTLDNCRKNLRTATNSQNQMNRRSQKNSVSRHKGVHFYKRYQRWQSQISYNNKRIQLGYFKYEQDAALAYNEAARKYHGEFAYFNSVFELPIYKEVNDVKSRILHN